MPAANGCDNFNAAPRTDYRVEGDGPSIRRRIPEAASFQHVGWGRFAPLAIAAIILLVVVTIVSPSNASTQPPSAAAGVSGQAGPRTMPLQEKPLSVGSLAGPGPLTQKLFHLQFETIPSNCTIEFFGEFYGSGVSNDSVAAGSYSIDVLPCGGEAFSHWSTTAGMISLSTTTPTTVYIDSNGTLTATFVTGYAVTFNESGLVVGTQWSLSLGNALVIYSTVNQITENEPNGTYNYTISPQFGFVTRPPGNVTVQGRPVTIQVNFVSIVYAVTFSVTGLPSETTWSVLVGSVQTNSMTPSISLDELNGTYAFSIYPPSGYTTNVSLGTVHVHGEPQTILLSFSKNSGSTGPFSSKWIVAAVGGAVIIVGGAAAGALLWRRKPPA